MTTNCGFCGAYTTPDNMIAGLIACEECLIAEVTMFKALRDSGALAEALSMKPVTA